MKAYVNYLPDIPQSNAAQRRCTASCEEFGLDPIPYPAVWRDEVKEALFNVGLRVKDFHDHYSNRDAVIANFITQYKIWEEVANSYAHNDPVLILEHDAVVTAKLPDIEWPEITNVGKPSYGAFKTRDREGLYPLFSKPWYLPGAHAYIITRLGAQHLIKRARMDGVEPVDLFISNKRFTVHEYYPWPVECKDTFTTIQKETGCEAKHNWDKEKYHVL